MVQWDANVYSNVQQIFYIRTLHSGRFNNECLAFFSSPKALNNTDCCEMFPVHSYKTEVVGIIEIKQLSFE